MDEKISGKCRLTVALSALFMASVTMSAPVYADKDKTDSAKANAAAAEALKHAQDSEMEHRDSETEKKVSSESSSTSQASSTSQSSYTATGVTGQVRYMEGCRDIVSTTGTRESSYYLTNLINAAKARAQRKESSDDGFDDRSDKEKDDDAKLANAHDCETDANVKAIEAKDAHDTDRKVSSHVNDLFPNNATGKIKICHNGHTITVAMAAAGGHAHHDSDTIGACTQMQKDEYAEAEDHEKTVYESEHQGECYDDHDRYVSSDDGKKSDDDGKKSTVKKDCHDGIADNSSYINSKYGNAIIKVTLGTGDGTYNKAINDCLQYGGGSFVPGNPGGVASVALKAAGSSATSSGASTGTATSGGNSGVSTAASGNSSGSGSNVASNGAAHGGRVSLREIKK